MQFLKILPAVLLLSLAAFAQDYRHNAKPATHRSFNREMGSKQKSAKAANKARKEQNKHHASRRAN